MSILVTSPAFEDGMPIPRKYAAEPEGQNVSPPLSWTGIPDGAKELALVCEDPDAPMGTWIHWVIYKIPVTATGLSEGIAQDKRLKDPRGVFQGKNSWPSGQTIGYRGPLPPPGSPHRYFFRLFALEAHLAVQPGMAWDVLQQDITGHVLEEGQLMGTYER